MYFYGPEHAHVLTALRIMSSRETNSNDIPSEVDDDADGDETGDSEVSLFLPNDVFMSLFC